MTRTVNHSTISTPASRQRLKQNPKPFWQEIDSGVHLGYRRGPVGGNWCVRIYLGNNKYSTDTFAVSDDHRVADGIEVLNFQQAKRHALDMAAAPAIGPFSVAQAMESYFDRLRQKGRKVDNDERRSNTHIIDKIGSVPVDSLDRETLDRWLAGVAAGRDGKGPNRARKASANRVATILRAALNQSYKDGKCASDRAWRSCSPFRSVDAPRERFFTQDELRRLINASQGDFRLLVKAALMSGCRYGELTRLRVDDWSLDGGFVHVRESKSGRPRDIYVTDEGHQFFVGLTAGRAGSDLMLTRDGLPWLPTSQTVPMRAALTAARIDDGHFHLLRHAAASYWLMSGVSLVAVSRNLGHSDTRITEKVYAHLTGDHRRGEMQKAALIFGAVEPSSIVPFVAGSK